MTLNAATKGQRRLMVASSIGLLCSATGCGIFGGPNQQTMRASPSIPSSEGTVESSLDDNGNVRLAIEVKRLPHPSKVAPGTTLYVVWVQPGSAQVQNAGSLTVDDDQTGRLETVTPYKRFQLTVSPEPSAAGSRATHDAVFTADVDESDD
jgi:hypothetical protein